MNFRADSKGIIGVAISSGIATLVIIAVLLIFVVGSGVIRNLGDVRGDVGVIGEARTGIEDVILYVLDDFEDHVTWRSLSKGKGSNIISGADQDEG